ncbi:MAG: hypothetical protein HHAS10_08420 [Candidatus Altimarinota bacterium]
MKNYSLILKNIDRTFEKALNSLKKDPIFSSNQTLYTDDDKNRIALYWKDILKPFGELQRIIRSLMWRSFFTFGSKNIFVVKYSAIITYYNMVYELQQSFGPHEEFLRQYLDDTFSENYSTLARFMYHIRFYSILSYPREYFLSLRDEVIPSLAPLFDRPEKHAGDVEKRWKHDLINIWYYVRYKMSLVLTWISKHGGRLMMHIHLRKREHGLISLENLKSVEKLLSPGDILLTRGNWAATNLNIPGFWKHMAMYIGTGKYLKDSYTYEKLSLLDDSTHYIIEAIGVGVQIIPLESLCGHNDYLGVLRPKFKNEKVSRAIEKTLKLEGKSYDYSFNYYSDVNYVCSTLVTKAYLPESYTDEGIHISLTRIGTGITYPPNDIVKKYSVEYMTKKEELTFVAFIDCIDKTGQSFLATEEAFRSSGFRPKLSFFLP